MPIRPENRQRYPSDWRDISLRIRFDRADGRCECEGECGSTKHVWWKRLHNLGLEPTPRCPNEHGKPSQWNSSTIVVLTTAHLNHVPEDCGDDNLRAMCQSCHLNYDREHHAKTRRATAPERRAAMDAEWIAGVREVLAESGMTSEQVDDFLGVQN